MFGLIALGWAVACSTPNCYSACAKWVEDDQHEDYNVVETTHERACRIDCRTVTDADDLHGEGWRRCVRDEGACGSPCDFYYQEEYSASEVECLLQ